MENEIFLFPPEIDRYRQFPPAVRWNLHTTYLFSPGQSDTQRPYRTGPEERVERDRNEKNERDRRHNLVEPLIGPKEDSGLGLGVRDRGKYTVQNYGKVSR